MSSSSGTEMMGAGDDGGMIEGAAASPPVNPLLQVHALLRGRYWIAAILAVIGAVVGGAVGYRLQPLEYASSGIITMQPAGETLMYKRENGVPRNYDGWLESQMALIRSQRVISFAMEQAEWKA